jgi:phosphoribosylglycinamide formyltransferase-1
LAHGVTIFAGKENTRVLMPSKKLAIFASGAGTNADAIAKYFAENEKVEISLIITNRSEAGVLKVAERHDIPSLYLPKSDWQDEELVLNLLDEFGVDLIILAGWLLLIPRFLVKHFEGRILNIHPALLPKYGGKGMYGSKVHRAVKEAGDKESGITIHQVNENYDEGGIVQQFSVKIETEDSVEDIESKVRKLELSHYPEVIEKFIFS